MRGRVSWEREQKVSYKSVFEMELWWKNVAHGSILRTFDMEEISPPNKARMEVRADPDLLAGWETLKKYWTVDGVKGGTNIQKDQHHLWTLMIDAIKGLIAELIIF